MIKLTNSQMKAVEMARRGENILLTGKPGTGKTVVLQQIISEAMAAGKNVHATGSTGMAASNFVGGRTIHSLLGWNKNVKDDDYKACAKRLEDIDLIIVDEVSMLTGPVIYHFVKCLEELERQPQIIMSGDFFQLPPVKDQRYPFEHPYWPKFNLQPCVLFAVIRQSDAEFKNMLERAMYGDASCLPYFNQCLKHDYDEDAIHICTTNSYADRYNRKCFAKLNTPIFEFEAKGETKYADFENTRVKRTLFVRVGMRVMTTRNDSAGLYVNGSLGTVTEVYADSVKVQFDNGNTVVVNRIEYILGGYGDASEAYKVYQLPLQAGYAITIHKSQGQTFDAINLVAPKCWDAGQLYVALSRARTLEGIHLEYELKPESLKTNPRVINFYQNLLCLIKQESMEVVA